MIRNISRELFQGIRDQAPKSDSAIKSANDSACSSKQMKIFSGTSNPRNYSRVAKGSGENKLKQAEESFRTVMYLSCWGPN